MISSMIISTICSVTDCNVRILRGHGEAGGKQSYPKKVLFYPVSS
jgi:hypothetical protein